MKIRKVYVSLLGMIFFILLSIYTGLFIIEKLCLVSENTNKYFLITSSFFVGQTMLLLLFRFSELIFRNMKYACWFTNFVGLVVVLTFLLEKRMLIIWKGIGGREIAAFVGTVIVIMALSSIIYNDYFPSGDNIWSPDGKIYVYSHLGTVHSPRIVNVMKTAMEENRIPMIGINYGIPLVLIWFGILGDVFSYFTQILYYGVNNAFAFFFIAGFIKECFGGSFGFIYIGTIFIFSVSEGMSVRYKLCTDATGCTNPGICQYPDVWMMMCLALFYFRVIYNAAMSNCGMPAIGLFSLFCAVGWALLAPQIGIMGIGTLVCCSVWLLCMGNIVIAGTLVVLLVIMLAGMLCSGWFGGGMLHRKDRVRQDIPGSECGNMKFTLGYYGFGFRDVRETKSFQLDCVVLQNIGVILRVFALPLVTLTVYFTIITVTYNRWEFWIAFVLLVLLGGGGVLCYCLSTNGTRKAELTRFLAPALVFSKVAWVGILACGADWSIWRGGVGLSVFLLCSSVPFYSVLLETLANGESLISVWFTLPEKVEEFGPYDISSEFYDCILENNTQIIFSIKELEKKKVYIYGTGSYAEKLYDNIQKEDEIYFVGFIDSKPAKWKEKIDGNVIFSPQKIGKIQQDEIVLIGSELRSGILGIYNMCYIYGLKNIVGLSSGK